MRNELKLLKKEVLLWVKKNHLKYPDYAVPDDQFISDIVKITLHKIQPFLDKKIKECQQILKLK